MRFMVPESEIIPYKTLEGDEYIQVFQVFPWMEPFYFEWEKNFNVAYFYKFIMENGQIPIAAVIVYLCFIIEGGNYMKNRKGFDLKYLLGLWNFFLSAFSFWGMARVVPHMMYMMYTMSLKEQSCAPPEKTYGDGAAGLWVMLFTVSKVFELIDTVFIILRKKNLMFLHWYHHVTVLLYTWFSYSKRNPGIYFVGMNYTVHAFMYGYFCLMAFKMVPKWFNPMWLTCMQINQMFVGVSVTISSYYFKKNDPDCAVVPEMLVWCGLMYATYFYLFIEFAVKRFILKTPTGLEKPKKSVKTN